MWWAEQGRGEGEHLGCIQDVNGAEGRLSEGKLRVERRASRVKNARTSWMLKSLMFATLTSTCVPFFKLHFLCFHVVSGLGIRRLIISKGHGSQSPDVPIEP